MANSKIEFYRFKLKHKKDDFKTFREFAIEELHVVANSQQGTIVKALFKHFLTSLDGDYAKDDKIKKTDYFDKEKKCKSIFRSTTPI